MLSLVLVLLVLPLHAQLSDTSMIKITYRVVNDNLPGDSFYLTPRTLYRMGTRYGRLEEMYNPVTGIHMRVIIDEPHAWIVNLKTNTAKYLLDQGPTIEFHSPMFPSEEKQSPPPFNNTCEFGLEFMFLKNNKAVKTSVKINNVEYDRYHAKFDRYEMTLVSHKGKDIHGKSS